MNGKRLSSIALMIGTVGVALGSGYFMENSAPTVSPNVRAVPVQVAAIPETQAQQAKTPGDKVDLNEVELTASPLPEIPVDIFQQLNMPNHEPMRASVSEKEIRVPDTVQVPGGLDCGIQLIAEPTIAAMVNVELHAACLPETRVTLHHNGLMISELTDAQGELFVTLPALAETAVYMADLGGGQGATASVQVPSLRFYDRAVVQWQGSAGLHLHVMEFGAEFGAEGHIWDEQTGSLEKTIRGEGGFLTIMGDPTLTESLQAQVYTFPSGTSARTGDIQLEIEAEVTAMNCGKDVNAQSIQLFHAGKLRVQELQLAMPECEAVGDYLVLKNVLEDLKVASK
ncbi:hypothetical protein [Thalassovita sp.]|uniref:hypothetical protein n=1 Tax=Thalassovita sp. TaxID=1979401 RepID=UPI0029DE79FA|nr:hypothetical protein [Thalassovita sp.]